MQLSEVLDREAVSQGRPITLIEESTLGGDVRCVLYECRSEPSEQMDGQVMIQRRLAAYGPNGQMFSAIADTRWEKP